MDQLEKNLNRVHEWIRAVDQKVSIFLAFQGVVLTLLIPDFDLIFKLPPQVIYCNKLKIFFGIAGVIILIFSCYKSIMVLISKISIKKGQNSFIFFGDIADMTHAKFKESINKAKPQDYENEYIDQIYISSKIAKNKHVLFREAIIIFAISMSLLSIYFLM